MKDKGQELREEIERVIKEHALDFPSVPTIFPPELIARVVAYVKERGKQGASMARSSEELNLPKTRLHYWMYQRRQKGKARPLPPVGPFQLRPVKVKPVQVSAETVPVYDGIRERRYTVRSPAGWEVKELSLEELVEVLRRLI